MISVFINNTGYYIKGGGIEIARRCPQSADDSQLYHEYKVLLLALVELKDVKQKEDVAVYNNTRIIDEMNGHTKPLDDACMCWQRCIRREVLSNISSIVFFVKKTSEYIDSNINSGFQILLNVDPTLRQQILEKQEKQNVINQKKKRTSIIDKFRKNWLGDSHE